MWASALHEPLQLAWHLPLQSADGGVPVHLPEHSPEHVALQDAWHCAESEFEAHEPWHVPSQVPLQLASQSKLPGSAVHLPEQLPSQVAWHDGSVAVQPPAHEASSWPRQAASKLTGVHFALQSTPTSALHVASAWTSMFPQASIPARAGEVMSGAASAATRAKERYERYIKEPPF
jgi:hypothetical protein